MGRWLPILVVLALAGCPAHALHRYWPQVPRPQRLLVTEPIGGHLTPEHFLLQSLAGLSARRVGETGELVWVNISPNAAYDALQAAMLAQTGARLDGPHEPWALVRRLAAAGMVKGYVLFPMDRGDRGIYAEGPMDESSNAAAMLCYLHQAVMVEESLEPQARAAGLRRLADARGLTAADVWRRHAGELNHSLILGMDPRLPHMHDVAVFAGCPAVSRVDADYPAALDLLEPDSPLVGWPVGGEDQVVTPLSQRGLFGLASNWCHNLLALSTEQPGETVPWARLRRDPAQEADWARLTWQDDVHYATYLMSDGDNVQWVMGNFVRGPEAASYYGNPRRGEAPLGWTLPTMDLAQCSPYTLEDIVRSATPNDAFVLFGGGYYYPDVMARTARGRAALRLHARRLAEYARGTGSRLLALNCWDWDSPAALAAYRLLAAALPDLLGIFVVQYYPYTEGNGRVLWVEGQGGDRVPVVGCRVAQWALPPGAIERNAGPRALARLVNDLPHTGPAADEGHFTWGIVHAWSWFRDGDGEDVLTEPPPAGAERGYTPYLWHVRRLDPHVRVLRPDEWLLMLRLRLRPQETLRQWLAGLPAPRTAAQQATRRRAELLVERVHDQAGARVAFAAAQRAAAAVRPR